MKKGPVGVILAFFISFVVFPGLAMAQGNRFDAKTLLETIAKARPNEAIKIDPSIKPEVVEAAFKNLHARLKPNDNRPEKLDVDPAFERELTPEQKTGLEKIKKGYEQKVSEGEVKPERGSSGKWEAKPGRGGNEGHGRGNPGNLSLENEEEGLNQPLHAVGDGWWRWNTSYSWWGVKVSVNHNFLWYLCAYTSWMLSNSGLPGWIRTVLSWIVCAPHNCDGGADGGTVYITWALVFWYGC